MVSPPPVPFLDPRTIVLLTGVMGGLMAVVLYFLRRNYPPNVRGLGTWSLAAALLFFGGLAAGSRGFSHDLISITLANFLIFNGCYFQYIGSRRFFDVPMPVAPGMAVIVLLTLVSGWFTVITPSYFPRLVISITIMTTLFLAHAYLIHRHGPRSFSHWFAFCVLLCAAASQGLRLATAMLYPLGTGIMDNTPQNLAYILAYPFLMLLFAISLVLLATDRVRREFEHLASHDSLTNALTRRHLVQVCAQELERCQRHGRVMSMLMIDLDHFKRINDTRGHQVGDMVLVQFVAAVNQVLRSADVIGRQGGEEFVVVLPETPMDVASVVAERIRARVGQIGSPIQLTVSIGLTTNLPIGDSVDAMLARSDAAMYRAKEQGRNQVVIG